MGMLNLKTTNIPCKEGILNRRTKNIHRNDGYIEPQDHDIPFNDGHTEPSDQELSLCDFLWLSPHAFRLTARPVAEVILLNTHNTNYALLLHCHSLNNNIPVGHSHTS